MNSFRMNDLEKGSVDSNKDHLTAPDSSSGHGEPSYEQVTHIRWHSMGSRFVDSFKPDPNLNMTRSGVVGANGRVFHAGIAAAATAASPLSRSLKCRHLQMIGFGGSIGLLLLPRSLIDDC